MTLILKKSAERNIPFSCFWKLLISAAHFHFERVVFQGAILTSITEHELADRLDQGIMSFKVISIVAETDIALYEEERPKLFFEA